MRKYLAATLLALAANGAWALAEGQDYVTLKKPIPQEYPDKVDVTEFLSYTCSHCFHMEPRVEKFRETLPKDVNFRQLPVVWDEDTDIPLATMAAAVNLAGNPPGVNLRIFQALFNDGGEPVKVMGKDFNPLDFNQMGQWLVKQKDIDGKTVVSFFNNRKAKRMAKEYADMTNEYEIFSTPSIIVGGKYKVLAKDHGEKDFAVIMELVDKVKSERGKPANSYQKSALGAGAAMKAIVSDSEAPDASTDEKPANTEADKKEPTSDNAVGSEKDGEKAPEENSAK